MTNRKIGDGMPLAGPKSISRLPSNPVPGRAGFRLGIAAASFALWDELIHLVRISLSPLGFEVRRITPPEVSGRDWDGFLWLGNGDGLQPFADAVAGLGRNRPPTLLWQLDPLPPPDLPPEAEEIGLRVARWDEGPASASLRRIVFRLIPFRRQWIRLARSWGLRRLENLGPVGREFAQPGGATVARLSRYWNFIRRETERGTLDQVATSLPTRLEFLRRRGIPAMELPLGFHPAMGCGADGKDGELVGSRDCDVVFLGALRHTRRPRILRTLRAEWKRRGIRFLVVHRHCFGRQRTHLLRRAKIVLNLNTVPWDMPGFRFLTAVGCGAMVVSEPIRDPTPFRPGEHYVEAAIPQLPDVVEHFLRDEAGRKGIVAAARSFLETEHSWDRSMLKLGSWFHAHSAVSARGV